MTRPRPQDLLLVTAPPDHLIKTGVGWQLPTVGTITQHWSPDGSLYYHFEIGREHLWYVWIAPTSARTP